MAPKRFTDDDIREMRRLRYDEHLTCAVIAERFGCSRNCVSVHTKAQQPPKPSDLRLRWEAMLPDMRAAVKAAAGRA